MQTITSISLINLRNDGHFQFMTEVRNLLRQPVPPFLRDLLGNSYIHFLADWEIEDLALEKIRKSSLTAIIEKWDKVRDAQHHALGILLNGYINSPDTYTVNWAQQLLIVYNTYGSMAHKTLNEETAAISNLCNDLLVSGGAVATTLGVKDLIERLNQSNINITSNIAQRGEEEADKNAVPNAAQARIAVDEDYRQITTIVQALALTLTEPEATRAIIEQFIDNLNIIIARYKKLLKTTGKRPVNPLDDPEDGEEIIEETIIEKDLKIEKL